MPTTMSKRTFLIVVEDLLVDTEDYLLTTEAFVTVIKNSFGETDLRLQEIREVTEPFPLLNHE